MIDPMWLNFLVDICLLNCSNSLLNLNLTAKFRDFQGKSRIQRCDYMTDSNV